MTDLAVAQQASRELIARSPFRETGYRFLMEALAGGGNFAEALRVYDELRVLLRDELGTAPAGELQALHQRLLAGEDAGREIAVEPAAAFALPRQLAPRERSAFVARERELDVLREAWRDARAGSRRLVLVAGEPGIGKTRLTTEFARRPTATGRSSTRPARRMRLSPTSPSSRRCAAPRSTGRGSRSCPGPASWRG